MTLLLTTVTSYFLTNSIFILHTFVLKSTYVKKKSFMIMINLGASSEQSNSLPSHSQEVIISQCMQSFLKHFFSDS